MCETCAIQPTVFEVSETIGYIETTMHHSNEGQTLQQSVPLGEENVSLLQIWDPLLRNECYSGASRFKDLLERAIKRENLVPSGASCPKDAQGGEIKKCEIPCCVALQVI